MGTITPLLHQPFSGKTPPRKPRNQDRRAREYLTHAEVEALIKAAKAGRHSHRDATLILLMYRHGLRVSEAVALRWDAVDLSDAFVHVSRLKNGRDSSHPLTGREVRALRRLKREAPGAFVFQSERGGPMTDSNARKMVAKAGERAALGFPVHPHMLRHACGYKLANDGADTRTIQDYLGHQNIAHTVRYTELAHGRFNGLWKD